MKTYTYEWNDVHKAATKIASQLDAEDWRPDYIVGITRGGLPLSVILSHMIKVPMHSLDVSLRDNTDIGPESNCWMSEDAFGSSYNEETHVSENHPDYIKNILIVDDINDTGATFNWIVNDWQSSCLPDHDRWSNVWGKNVRFAVMTENESSNFEEVSYYYDKVNKAHEDVWLNYPWE